MSLLSLETYFKVNSDEKMADYVSLLSGSVCTTKIFASSMQNFLTASMILVSEIIEHVLVSYQG